MAPHTKRKQAGGNGGTSKSQNKKQDNNEDDKLLYQLAASSTSTASAFLTSWKAAMLVALLSLIVAGVMYFSGDQSSLGSAPKSEPSKSAKKETAQKSQQKRLTMEEIIKRAKTLPCKDRQDTNFCAELASRGDCDSAVGWMTVMCGASCNRCELLDPKKRCSEENMGIKFVDAYKPGDLNNMFESLIQRKDLNITVMNKEPYMLLVRNFISDKEGATLLKLTEKGLKRSTDQGEIGDDGFQEQVVSSYRTSSNSWCDAGCENHPIVKNLMARISTLVRVPVENFESFQVLRYEQTQKYDVHHDASANDFAMAAGPRVLTFFMYLSDVEEGGETHFPKLNISVRPEKGSALLWPSVENDFPNAKIEQLTYHAALPVKKGTKYAANSWIHLRDYKTPNLWGCTGAFD